MGRCAVLILVGPTDGHVAMVADLLDSLWYHEPAVPFVVLVDDAPGRLRGRALPAPRSSQLTVIDNPRHGRGAGDQGGMCAGVIAGLAWILRSTDARFTVKMDTDALVIGPFAAAIDAAFDARPSVGELGAFQTYPGGGVHEGDHWVPLLRGCDRRFPLPWAGLTDKHGTGWRRRLGRQIRAARANGYRYGDHCQGGAYAVSRAALEGMEAAGYLDDPVGWLRCPIPEDVVLSVLVQAVGLRCSDLVDEGDPFGVVWQGLAFPPDELVRRGYSLIHSVKNDASYSEAEIRAFFRDRRY